MTKSRKLFLLGLSSVFFVFFIYSNSFENSFHYDDVHSIIRNPHIKDIHNVTGFFSSPKMGSGLVAETSGYRPLLMVTLALNYRLGELSTFGYHLLNFFIHLGCAFFVFFIVLDFLRLTGGEKETTSLIYELTALFAALVFAVHPVQTEAVTYIMGRTSSLPALFFLLGFWAYMQYAKAGRLRHIFLSGFCYACALLAKESAITFPAILFLFDLFFPLKRTWKSRLSGGCPFIGLSVIYLGMRSYLFGSPQLSTGFLRPFYDNLITQFRAWVHYLGTLLAPLNLSVDYGFFISESILEPQVLGAILILGAAVVVLWKISKRHRAVGFFALWFAVNLLPTNSVIPLKDVVTDRWLYLPSVGFAAILALTAEWIFTARVRAGSRAGKMVFFFICALVLEVYGVATVLRNITWNSEWMLWEDAVNKSPKKDRPHLELANALVGVGLLQDAEKEYKKALEINPRNAVAHLNLACAYLNQGKLDEALEAIQKASAENNRSIAPEIHNNLGTVYCRQGRLQEAVEEFQKALEARPLDDGTYYNMGYVYEIMGDVDRATSCMEKAVQIRPEFDKAYLALHRLYGKRGWKEKSKEAYGKYLTYSPAALLLPATRQNPK